MRLVWSTYFLFTYCEIVAAISKHKTWKSLAAHIDVKFTSKIVLQVVTDHLRICATQCSNVNGCKSFNYNNQNGACILYSDDYMISDIDSSLVESGAKYFIPNDGYTLDRETMMYFKNIQIVKTHAEAQQYCKADGAELVILDTLAKFTNIWKVIYELYASHGSSFWVSGYYGDNGIWTFWNNASIPNAMWYNGVQQSGTNHCARVYNGRLSEWNCGIRMHFFCEKS